MAETSRMMYGYTYEQWMDPARLAKRAQEEWDKYQAMSDAFDLVQDKEHWKNPIDAVIPEEKRSIVEQAINYYAGGGARFVPAGEGKLRVAAPGYWGNGF